MPYEQKKAREILGLSRGGFDQWMARGIAKPSHPSRGRGYPAKWDIRSLIRLRLTQVLNERGVELHPAAKIATYITDENFSIFPGFHITAAVDMKTYEWEGYTGSPGKLLWKFIFGRETVIVICINEVIEYVNNILGIDFKEDFEHE